MSIIEVFMNNGATEPQAKEMLRDLKGDVRSAIESGTIADVEDVLCGYGLEMDYLDQLMY